MADDSLLPLSGDEKLALVAALKRSIDDDRYPSAGGQAGGGCPPRDPIPETHRTGAHRHPPKTASGQLIGNSIPTSSLK
jgi:hypothetical protein